jgi:hypothetical protein
MRKLVWVVSFLSFYTVIALADPPPPPAMPAVSPAKVAKIRLLMASFHVVESLDHEKELCIQNFQTNMYSPDKVAAAKGNFRGFKPGTPQWPEVLEAYKTFSAQSCSYYVPELFEQAYVKFYASRLSEADIDAYLAFQKTPAAQHMLATQQDSEAYFSAFQKVISEPAYKKASDQLGASLARVCGEEPTYERAACNP